MYTQTFYWNPDPLFYAGFSDPDSLYPDPDLTFEKTTVSGSNFGKNNGSASGSYLFFLHKSQYSWYFNTVLNLKSVNTARKVQFRRMLTFDVQTGSDRVLKTGSGSDRVWKTGSGSDHISNTGYETQQLRWYELTSDSPQISQDKRNWKLNKYLFECWDLKLWFGA